MQQVLPAVLGPDLSIRPHRDPKIRTGNVLFQDNDLRQQESRIRKRQHLVIARLTCC